LILAGGADSGDPSALQGESADQDGDGIPDVDDLAPADPDPDASQGTPPAANTEAESTQGISRTVPIGRPLKQGDYTLIVMGVEKMSRLPGDETSDPVPAEGRFLVLRMRITNQTAQATDLYIGSLVKLVDKDGTIYTSDAGGGERQIGGLPDYLSQATLQPKQAKTGTVAFDVPRVAKVVGAQFAESIDSSGDETPTGLVEFGRPY
jgi:Domain of unknown function (DUF4352)